jgi:hypothetical protein
MDKQNKKTMKEKQIKPTSGGKTYNNTNATFNNISDISWQSVLLVEETGVPGESHRPAASY